MQLLEEFGDYIVTGLVSLATGVISYFAARRRNVAETKQVEADVVKSIQELYGGLVADIKATAEESRMVREELQATRKGTENLSIEISNLRRNVRELEIELEDCRSQLLKI